jgi:hypothetical protein
VKFAKFVFIGAGIWGLSVLTPLYWLVDISGRHYAVPHDYPAFFYGFVAVALAWQIAFLVIGTDPVRFRPFMVLAMIEKFSYVSTLVVLYAQSRIPSIDFQPAIPDGLIGLLFIAAFWATRPSQQKAGVMLKVPAPARTSEGHERIVSTQHR